MGQWPPISTEIPSPADSSGWRRRSCWKQPRQFGDLGKSKALWYCRNTGREIALRNSASGICINGGVSWQPDRGLPCSRSPSLRSPQSEGSPPPKVGCSLCGPGRRRMWITDVWMLSRFSTRCCWSYYWTRWGLRSLQVADHASPVRRKRILPHRPSGSCRLPAAPRDLPCRQGRRPVGRLLTETMRSLLCRGYGRLRGVRYRHVSYGYRL